MTLFYSLWTSITTDQILMNSRLVTHYGIGWDTIHYVGHLCNVFQYNWWQIQSAYEGRLLDFLSKHHHKSIYQLHVPSQHHEWITHQDDWSHLYHIRPPLTKYTVISGTPLINHSLAPHDSNGQSGVHRGSSSPSPRNDTWFVFERTKISHRNITFQLLPWWDPKRCTRNRTKTYTISYKISTKVSIHKSPFRWLHLSLWICTDYTQTLNE